MIMIKKSRLLKWLSLTAITTSVIGIPLISYSLITKNDINVKQTSYTLDNNLQNSTREEQTSKYVKVKSLDDENLSSKERKQILNVYKLLPSEVHTKDSEIKDGEEFDGKLSPKSIFHLLEFDKTKVHTLSTNTTTDNFPKITNMSNASHAMNYKNDGKKIETKKEDELQYLNKVKDDNGAEIGVTQEYLNEIGLLILRIDMKLITPENGNSDVTEFITISGFNSSLTRQFESENIVLPAKEYSKSVNEISDNDLVLYPQFKDNSVEPTIRSLTTRENDPKSGKINYSLNFWYSLNEDITLNTNSNLSIISNNKANQSSSKFTTSYKQEFVLKGFQPSPNITEKEIIIILASIIGGGAVVGALVYLASIFTQKIRFKNSL